MALIVDQQTSFKHFCRICKKGFGCGRALGGHMRAHGIGDESGHVDDEDMGSDWEEKLGNNAGNVPPSNKRMYALRTNPNRLRSCRVCENCGKEFLSWKSFLEHGKCSSEDAESLVSSPESGDGDGDPAGRRGCGWSKRKRSFRAKVGNFNSHCPSSEEEDLANCLMMLSNAAVDHPIMAAEEEPEESCASASKEEERRNNNNNNQNSSINFIAPISFRIPNSDNKAKGVVANKGLFECKACKKVFNSHQALGGHRASHKKVKGCFAARLDNLEDSLADDDVITHEEYIQSKSNSTFQFDHNSNTTTPLASTSKRKSKVHECSICHRVFSSGQALGGHKRCHWITSNAPDTSALAKFQHFQESYEQRAAKKKFDQTIDLKLDLNLPAPPTEIFLQPWIRAEEEENKIHRRKRSHHRINELNNEINNTNSNNGGGSMNNIVEDEADSKVKLAKLSELKDMNVSEGSSVPWLQVGIGSTTDVGADS
ncbi:hypothetical protein UlMin_021466 [Ulmus minor]